LSKAQRVLGPWLAALLVLSRVAPLRGQPAEEAVRFQYTAAPDCPNVAGFTAQVRERTTRGRPAQEGELARTFTVKLTPDPKGYWGSIELLDDSGTKVARHLHGEQCEAVVSSLALIAALALDATLREEEAAAPVPVKTPAPTATASVASTPSAKQAAPPPRQLPPRKRTGARVGVSAGYDSAIHALPFGLLGQLDWISGFALRFAAHYAHDEFVVDDGRSAALRAMGLETSVCPWRLAGGGFALSPCAAFDVGTLHAEGVKADKLTSASGKTILWAAVGAELRLAWEPDAPVWIELRGAAQFPLVSHEFRFTHPDAEVLTVRRVSGLGGIVTGVRF
jgi:hypothetical protein